MLGPDDEAKHLMETIIFTLGVILENNKAAKQRIADAYSEARELSASIPWENGSARPRVTACIEQFRIHKDAEEVEAAGWMLCAVQERLSEQDLPDWESLKIIADKAATLLPPPRRTRH
jgi:hypothetical protein